ncbi:MAG: hypothetical protein WD425_11995 [Nitrospirales bacterium]
MIEKDNFQAGIEAQLHQWHAQIESASQTIADLKEKAEKLELDAKRDFLSHIEELESKIAITKVKIDEGQEHLDSIKAAGEEAWGEIKTGSQQAWGDLAQGLNEAWDTMKTSVDQASLKIKDIISKK